MSDPIPVPDPVDVPDELRERPTWVCWKPVVREGKATKIPMQPDGSGDTAKSNDIATWGTFANACAEAERRGWGVGFMFSSEGQYLGIDVDDCLNDRGVLREWLREGPRLDMFNNLTFMERSPSGGGVHVFLKNDGDIPEWWKNFHAEDDDADGEYGDDYDEYNPGVEAYDNGRFFTFTGDAIDTSIDTVGSVDANDLDEWFGVAWDLFHSERPQQATGDARDGAAGGADTGGRSSSTTDVEIGVYDVIQSESYPEGERTTHPFHGSSTGSNFKVDGGGETWRCWRHDCTGNVAHLLGIETGILNCGEWTTGTIDSETWRDVFDTAREQGYDIPEPARAQPDGGTAVTVPTEPTMTADQNASTTPTIPLSPDGVIAVAGLGEGDNVSDLDDRQKAACVWDLIKRSDEVHVRIRRDNDEVWAYDDGVWNPDGERELRHAARQALGAMNYGQNVLAELKAQARSDPEVEEGGNDFGLEPGLLAVSNGLIDLDTAGDDDKDEDARRDLRPSDLALNRVPTRYDPTAEYDEWAAYVEEWGEDGMADALQESVGYCLEVGSMPIHRALLLVGSGANGKGTFLSVVRSLLGDENYEAIDLQTLANEKDARADFYGMIANIDDDLSSRSLGKGLGMFKKLVAGEPVRARRLYQDGFKFQATGKHLYAANEVPDVDVPDDDEAFWRRWLLIEFPNHYPIDQQDPDLGERLSEPEALSGVLNWAIEGRKRLLDQGHFTNEDIHASQKRERWQAWGDSVGKFISECIERDENAVNITTTNAHRRYAAWCRENDEKPVGQQQLTNKLKNEDVGYGQSVRVGESVQRGYKALGFTDVVPAVADTPNREEPARVNLTNYDEAGDSDEDDESKPGSNDIAVNSAQNPIYKAIEGGDDGTPIGDVLDAVPHTAEKAREHIEVMINAGTIVRGDDGRLRTQ